SGGHGEPGFVLPPGICFSGGGARLSVGTSRKTSKKLDGCIGGTSNVPIFPKSGANTPNSWDLIVPLTGSDELSLLGLIQCMWKRVLLPTFFQSVEARTGRTRCQLHVRAQTSIVASSPPGTGPQMKLTLKQQVVPTGVDTGACTQIQPSQFDGSGFGAAVKS